MNKQDYLIMRIELSGNDEYNHHSLVELLMKACHFDLAPPIKELNLTDEDTILLDEVNRDKLYTWIKEEEYSFSLNDMEFSYRIVVSVRNELGFNIYIENDSLSNNHMKKLLKILTLTDKYINFGSLEGRKISQTIYESHYEVSPRTSFSPGLVWLQYYAHEELARQGGKEAIKQNPYIQYEEIGEGILVQVGDSPYDAYTKEGEELLVKATKAMPPVVEV